MILSKRITKKLDNYKEVKELFLTAFPKYEQHPLSYLIFLSKQKGNNFNAYYDDETFIGLSYTLNKDDTTFILYLAVNPNIRSKGYGSKILNIIKDNNINKDIVLNVERLDENANNFNQREKRIEFYKRNGFKLTNYYVQDKSTYFSIMNLSENLNVLNYKKAVSKFTLGLFKPNVVSDFKNKQ